MMNKYKKWEDKKRWFITILVVVVAMVVAVLISFTMTFEKVYNLLLEKDMEQIQFTSSFVTKLVYTEIENCLSALQSEQGVLWEYGKQNSAHVEEELKKIKEEFGFETTGVMDLKGRSLDHTGKVEQIEDPDFLETIRRNETYLSNVIEQSDIMMMGVPVMQNGEVKGAVWGYYSVSSIAESIELSVDSHRYFQIVDDEGIYISDSNNENAFAEEGNINIWEELGGYEISDGITVDKIREDMKNGQSGRFHFTYNGKGRYVTYEPLGIKNWYVFSILVEEYFSDYIGKIEFVFSRLLWGTLGAVVLIMGLIGYFMRKTMRFIQKQNGKLMAKNSLLFMVLEHTNNIPFEIDVLKQTFSMHRNKDPEIIWNRTLKELKPEILLEQEIISSEEYQKYADFYENIVHGKSSEPIVLKIKIAGKWNYKRVHMSIINQDYIVGVLEDYNEYMYQENRISEINKQMRIDSLTGLYSRKYFVQEMEEILREKKEKKTEESFALFLLDLDHFKEVNDTLGHMMGDRVLRETGRLLKEIIRNTDMAGRLGGDEFVLLIRDVKHVEGFKKCAEKINNALRRTYGEENQVIVSVSIGIAIQTNEETFLQLYHNADRALYKVKEKGRDGYFIMLD